ncbi:hypothetical protein HYH03_014516 [Edaphochlamys debaryana]|uniref:Uncharacterized protein n=1 Tax=Edaphochlamys debaryana TaxID=47281 RepID=A0A835XPY9_9CHLO|nr:hypothetical protein HYH03_014516 [Edaphochlamys debaryana]|eukprot:KAG2486833.1 hypothetical protein HYH03_014516 [Edaphochlamys debaryana]
MCTRVAANCPRPQAALPQGNRPPAARPQARARCVIRAQVGGQPGTSAPYVPPQVQPSSPFVEPHSRRGVLIGLSGGAAAITVASQLADLAVTPGAQALPLGPLGPVKRVGGEKRTGLTSDEVAEVLRRDLAVGQYFVTGDLTREVFADDCRFVDPTNDVTGLSKYLTALGVLFDPAFSKVELISISATGPRRVEADWRLGGYLVFPWNPRVEPFVGHTVYTLGDDGLIKEQLQTWDKPAATALQESFTPTFGPKKQLF